MKGGIYHPDSVSIGGNEKYGGIDISDIMDAIHEKGFYFDDVAVTPVVPSLYSMVAQYSYIELYDDKIGFGTEFASDTLVGLDPLWDYNVFCVYQFGIMNDYYAPYNPSFASPPPAFTFQAKTTITPTTRSISRTGYAGQKNVGAFATADGNVHMPYTFCDSFQLPVNVLRDGEILVFMDMEFLSPPGSTTAYKVSYQAKILLVAKEKP